MTLRDIHANWAWMVVFSNGLAGLWCLGAHWFAPLRLRAMWWFVVLAELTIFVQVILGVSMVAGEKIEAPQFHMFYGFVAIITVALLYAYRNQLRRDVPAVRVRRTVPDGSRDPGDPRRPRRLTAAGSARRAVSRC